MVLANSIHSSEISWSGVLPVGRGTGLGSDHQASTSGIGDEGLKRREDEKLRIARETEDTEWRAAFIPHAIILGDRKIPTSITMCVISGGPERWLKIKLDRSEPSNTFVQQAIAALPSKLDLGKDGRLSVPFFGYALGFIVNYSPDQAVRYDLKGNAVENLSKAFRSGEAWVSLKGGKQIADVGRSLEVVEISTI
jgi:hypothetical protein